MVSTSILKVVICQKPSRLFLHHGPSAFFTRKSFLCKPSVPDSSVRFLCTRDSNFSPNGKWTDRKHDGKTKNTVRQKGEEMWDGVGQGWRTRKSSPRSVFSAGNSKRTAEWLRRKSPLQDKEDQWEQPAPRSNTAGHLLLTFLTFLCIVSCLNALFHS